MAREAPAPVHQPKQPAGAPASRGPQAPARAARCLGAAAQFAAVHRVLRHGPAFQLEPRVAAADNRTGLPDRLKGGIEALSGVSLDGVKVHYNSPKPAQLDAHAYAQGSDIHLGPGQERHLPHEAWHIVQQAQGRVKPTLQLKGAALNDDVELEREADVMGARASRGGSGRQPMLGPIASGSARFPIQRVPLEDKTGQWVDAEFPHLKLMKLAGYAKNQFKLANGEVVYWQDVYCSDKRCSKPYKIPAELLEGSVSSSPKAHYLEISRSGTEIMSLDTLIGSLNKKSQDLLKAPDPQKLDAQHKAFATGHAATAPIEVTRDGKYLNLEQGRHRILASQKMGYTQIPVLIRPDIVSPYAASSKPSPGGGAKSSSSSASFAEYSSAAASYAYKGSSALAPYSAPQSRYSDKPAQGGGSSSASSSAVASYQPSHSDYAYKGPQGGASHKPSPSSSSSSASAPSTSSQPSHSNYAYKGPQGGASHKPPPSKSAGGKGAVPPAGGFEQWRLRRDILFRSSKGESPESIASALELHPDWVKQVVAEGK